MKQVELLEEKFRKLAEKQTQLEEKIEQMELILNYKVDNDDSDKKLTIIVTNLLHEIGIPANRRGYYYLRTAIIWGMKDVRSIEFITKDLYPNIAKKYGTTPSRVERAIRYSIEGAVVRGNIETIERIFGYTVSSKKGKPTNSEFIAMLVDTLKIRTV